MVSNDTSTDQDVSNDTIDEQKTNETYNKVQHKK